MTGRFVRIRTYCIGCGVTLETAGGILPHPPFDRDVNDVAQSKSSALACPGALRRPVSARGLNSLPKESPARSGASCESGLAGWESTSVPSTRLLPNWFLVRVMLPAPPACIDRCRRREAIAAPFRAAGMAAIMLVVTGGLLLRPIEITHLCFPSDHSRASGHDNALPPCA